MRAGFRHAARIPMTQNWGREMRQVSVAVIPEVRHGWRPTLGRANRSTSRRNGGRFYAGVSGASSRKLNQRTSMRCSPFARGCPRILHKDRYFSNFKVRVRCPSPPHNGSRTMLRKRPHSNPLCLRIHPGICKPCICKSVEPGVYCLGPPCCAGAPDTGVGGFYTL